MPVRIRESRKLRGDLWPYFVTALPDSGTDGDEQVFGPARKSLLHILERPDRNPLHRPTPSGVDCSDSALARIHHQNRDTVGRLYGNELSRRVLDQGIAVTERARAASGINHNVRMDLMKRGQVSTTTETVRPASAETVHQPIEGFQSFDAIDVLRIFVEHYAGFWT
jgi:hypothetical protein